MAVLNETFVPSDKDIEKAKAFSRTLAREIARESRISLHREGDGEAIEIPDAVLNVLMKVLSVMSEGKPFTLIPMDEELTTQQAADILSVSRPFLNKLLDLGDISYHKVGRNRRVKFSDVLAYKKQQERRSKDALQELADGAQELDMGY
ncbi:MAG: helix-turn-helix domain-containing protein [Pirellula sp.]|nr:helix-turn-helix domain-containing protein [Pirellula sp.]